MIAKLTKYQIAKFQQYVKEWTDIGLCTDRADRPAAEAAIRSMYECAGLKPPRRIVWCSSPVGNGLTRSIVFAILKEHSDKIFGASVRDSVRDSVWASVRASVGDSVRDSVWASVRASVWASVRASVGDSVYGQHDASWLAFYRFFHDECGLVEQTNQLSGLWALCRSAGWALPHQNICWVSERHNILHRNSGGQLHRDGDIALAYPDGWGVYALNGVRFNDAPKWVLEPAERLDAKEGLALKNAEQRREVIRKMGIERMLSHLPHQSLNKSGQYDLLSINLSDQVKDARYLKMLNPSIGVWHLEGVDPKCNTVQEALNWRASCKECEQWEPAVLT